MYKKSGEGDYGGMAVAEPVVDNNKCVDEPEGEDDDERNSKNPSRRHVDAEVCEGIERILKRLEWRGGHF